MLYVNTQERSPLILYKKYLYKYIKKNDLRFSEQREQVLKTLHGLSNPITIEALTELINREGYPQKFEDELRELIISLFNS